MSKSLKNLVWTQVNNKVQDQIYDKVSSKVLRKVLNRVYDQTECIERKERFITFHVLNYKKQQTNKSGS
jgi:hypothetical protein